MTLYSSSWQGDVNRLAEIIVGFALGLELSTLASVASGQFASAHEKLGRKHPQNGMKDNDVSAELFKGLMGDSWTLISHSPFKVCVCVVCVCVCVCMCVCMCECMCVCV